jgi:hypothetical protein
MVALLLLGRVTVRMAMAMVFMGSVTILTAVSQAQSFK